MTGAPPFPGLSKMIQDMELARTQEQTVTAPEDQPKPRCWIHHVNGDVFVVPTTGSWRHTEWGIFATGYWQRDTDFFRSAPNPYDVMIPYLQVSWVRFDFS